jgi:hypothetical protein
MTVVVLVVVVAAPRRPVASGGDGGVNDDALPPCPQKWSNGHTRGWGLPPRPAHGHIR